jgi:hypothetical protein
MRERDEETRNRLLFMPLSAHAVVRTAISGTVRGQDRARGVGSGRWQDTRPKVAHGPDSRV